MRRREFISRLLKTVGGVFLFWAGMIKKAEGKPLVFELGFLRDYPPGTVKHLVFIDAFIVSDEEGVYALSSICTHNGGPTFYPAREPGAAFVCRRHHSLFDIRGEVVRGPAREPLPWLKLELTPEGRLKLHRKFRGERGVKIPHEGGGKG